MSKGKKRRVVSQTNSITGEKRYYVQELMLVDFGVDNMYRSVEQIFKDREWTWLNLKHDGSMNIGISGTHYYDTEDLAYAAIECFIENDRRLEINSAWEDDE